MGRLVALDIGRKRTGVAATDLLQIVPNGLGFLPTHEVADWLKNYAEKEPIDLIVVGEPKQANGNDSESVKYIDPVVNRLRKLLPMVEVVRYDERFTTVLAQRAMLEAGLGKMKRREKGRADEVSAVIILQGFMESRIYQEKYKK
ncbi:Holliday junction resolvase RuvX [uncultured Porphyromonas sp.]|uniref:Holliday junction resolvase RuvX n=1 Tax=uncultured Porphyromonas sp. TaxID=159274 RepID=UPI00261E136B|nr:Holliday junction resolvase RuvX [uncultured Porphyromonas sp.]